VKWEWSGKESWLDFLLSDWKCGWLDVQSRRRQKVKRVAGVGLKEVSRGGMRGFERAKVSCE
jgi:hypothetical protein